MDPGVQQGLDTVAYARAAVYDTDGLVKVFADMGRADLAAAVDLAACVAAFVETRAISHGQPLEAAFDDLAKIAQGQQP